MIKNGMRSMLFPVLLIVLANGIITFAYAASRNGDSQTLWALLTVNYLVFLGLTQTGIIFSTIMRVAKSSWARYFNRLGEVLTLSSIPVAVIGFIIIYCGGAEHLFFWLHHGAEGAAEHGEHISPWLNKDLFIWRYVVTMVPFYFLSYLYFRGSREEEKNSVAAERVRVKMNFLGGFVMFFYVWGNTNLAWDFAMMVIPHWESSIFPGFYWVGNLLSAPAFLFILARVFIKDTQGDSLDVEITEPMGKFFMGFVLTWIYMYWSQHIVEWYPALPEKYGPVLKQMSGHYLPIFVVMMSALFIVPFILLLFRRIKLTIFGLTTIAVILCLGLWLNRFLLVLPVYSDGSSPALGTYLNISLLMGFLAATMLSIIFFFKLFPHVTVKLKGSHEGH